MNLPFFSYKMNCTKTLKKRQHAARKPAFLLKPEALSWSLNFYLWLSFDLRGQDKLEVAKQSRTSRFYLYQRKAIVFCEFISQGCHKDHIINVKVSVKR